MIFDAKGLPIEARLRGTSYVPLQTHVRPPDVVLSLGTSHEQVMAAGGGDFERALGAFLTLDVGKVERRPGRFQDFGLRPRQHLCAFEMIGELNKGKRGPR